MSPEELELRTRQELINVILILIRILKEEDAVIEQNGILLCSEKVEELKNELKDMQERHNGISHIQ